LASLISEAGIPCSFNSSSAFFFFDADPFSLSPFGSMKCLNSFKVLSLISKFFFSYCLPVKFFFFGATTY